MKQKEQLEADLLLGVRKTVLTTRFLGIPINWKMSKMTLAKMLQLSRLYTKINIDEDAVLSDDTGTQLAAQYQSVRDNTRIAATVLAIAVDSWLPRWLLKWHFMRSVDANELQKFVIKTLQTSNFANFTSSIFLMNGSRITKPKRIE